VLELGVLIGVAHDRQDAGEVGNVGDVVRDQSSDAPSRNVFWT
jgi:hypothetical protein